MTAPTLPVAKPGVQQDERVSLDAWALVQQVQAGDMRAFDPLYRRYEDLVFRFIYHRTSGNKPLTEDLCSEVFLRAMVRIDHFTWEGRDFGAWLITIARNLVADHFKSGRYRYEAVVGDIRDAHDGPDESPEAHPEVAVLNHLTNLALLSAMKDLTPAQREVLVLRFLRDLTIGEICDLTGKEAGAVKTLIYRAVDAMARALGCGIDERGRPPRYRAVAKSQWGKRAAS